MPKDPVTGAKVEVLPWEAYPGKKTEDMHICSVLIAFLTLVCCHRHNDGHTNLAL